MDYLGYNIYFQPQDDLSEEEQPEIQQYLTVQDFISHPEMPGLDDFPFEQDKKLQSTLQVGDEEEKEGEAKGQEGEEKRGEIIFQQKYMDKYRQAHRGSKDDTVQLNINFKTLIVHYFKQLMMINELNEHEVAHLRQFKERVPSLHSLMLFFKRSPHTTGIRARSLEFFSSRECLRRILASRSRMKNKLQMIKFIEKMRFNILTEGSGRRWKQVDKKQS